MSHLRSTLFEKDGRACDRLEVKLRVVWERIEVSSCRTKANRFFCVRCMKCKQCSYGQYGTWAASVDSHKPAAGAKDDLAKFFKI